MRTNYMGAFPMVLGVLLLPAAAHANGGPCNGSFECYSYLTYDPNNNLVSGYSIT
jgi:hypothetical protein